MRKTFSLITIFLISVILISALSAFQDSTPTRIHEPKVPFRIQAPWPEELTWEAGGTGSHYGDFLHQLSDAYALDFNASDLSDAGDLVLAIADGEVVDADCNDNGSYGCRVVIGHPLVHNYCYESMYAHLQENLLVDELDYVSQGEPIGQVGSTGIGAGNEHLHFSIHRRPSNECAETSSANRIDMAVYPEPLAGSHAIDDGESITSTTYSVGYIAFNDEQVSGDANLPERREGIFRTYQREGGSFGRFGVAQGPVMSQGNIFYQLFGPYEFNHELAWYGFESTVVEHDDQGYFLYRPIWDRYSRDIVKYGVPISDSYQQRNESGTVFYRNDFSNQISLIWRPSNPSDFEIVENDGEAWQAEFWPQPDTFSGSAHGRIDHYIDFFWNDVSEFGPFTSRDGISAKWRTKKGGWISAYQITVQAQGHIEIRVDGEIALDIDSPDRVWEGNTKQFGIGSEDVEVYYWQEGGKTGRVKIGVKGLIPGIPKAFASEGEIFFDSPRSPGITYARFEPALRDNDHRFYGGEMCTITTRNGIDHHAITDDKANVICVDLTDPFIRIETVMANDVFNVNPVPDQREKVAEMADRDPYKPHNPTVAFNADYFGAGHGAEGFTVNNGLRIDGPNSSDYDGNETNRVSFSISRLNAIDLDFKSTEDVSNQFKIKSSFYNSFGGGPTLVIDGNLLKDPCPREGFSNADECAKTSQTAIGVSQDGQTLIIIAAETKTGEEMGELLMQYGAFRGMKLDGGGSTQLWYRGESLIKPETGVANALLVFREEIPRHDAQLSDQSRYPIVTVSDSFTMTHTLRNKGFLPWEPDLPYKLRHIDGELFNLDQELAVPASVPTGVELQWVMHGVAPGKPGIYPSHWQMTYENAEGVVEVFGPKVTQVVVVVPGDTPPNVMAALRQLLDQYQNLLVQELEQYWAELIQQFLQRIEDDLKNLIPPELLCLQSLLGVGILFSGPLALMCRSRKRSGTEDE